MSELRLPRAARIALPRDRSKRDGDARLLPAPWLALARDRSHHLAERCAATQPLPIWPPRRRWRPTPWTLVAVGTGVLLAAGVTSALVGPRLVRLLARAPSEAIPAPSEANPASSEAIPAPSTANPAPSAAISAPSGAIPVPSEAIPVPSEVAAVEPALIKAALIPAAHRPTAPPASARTARRRRRSPSAEPASPVRGVVARPAALADEPPGPAVSIRVEPGVSLIIARPRARLGPLYRPPSAPRRPARAP